MIRRNVLRKIAKARLEDATALLASKRFDGAVYLCGYAIELALKARICRTLDWQGYPSNNKEFQDYQSFRVHNLDVLLHLSGREQIVKTKYLAEWSAVAQWDPSSRYKAIGMAKKTDTQLMISSARILLRKL